MAYLTLTDTFIEQASRLLRQGNYVVTVCGVLGVSQETWYNWLRQAKEAAKKDPSTLTDKDLLFLRFSESVTQATDFAVADAVEQWRKHFPDDYRAIRDFLERRQPDLFGKTQPRPLEKSDETAGLLKTLFDKMKASLQSKED